MKKVEQYRKDIAWVNKQLSSQNLPSHRREYFNTLLVKYIKGASFCYV